MIRNIPIPVAIVFLVEAALLLSLATRIWKRLEPGAIVALHAACCALPYLVLAIGTGTFSLSQAVVVVLMGLFPLLWLYIIPRHRSTDLLLVAAIGAVFASSIFRAFYGEDWSILGRVMWVRSGLIAFLYIAKESDIHFGFWPAARDWAIGSRFFVLFLVPGLLIGWRLGYLDSPRPLPLQGLGMFAGSLFFVALAEEFFFRGLLQRWIGLWAAAILFGLSHLGFRTFPNWRHVIITAVLGVFCGLAYRKAGSVRAAVVTHSLVNGLWVALLGKP